MPKTPQRRLTYKERKQVDITRQLGIPQQTISICLKSLETPTKPKGRPPILDTPLRQLLTRKEIAHELGINVCRRSLIKAFKKELYHRQKATEKPFINGDQRHQRSDEQWASVGWSNKMSARTGAGEVYVIRLAKEKFHRDCIIPKFKGYSSCIAWSIITLDAKGPLVIFEKEWCTNAKGTIDSKVYIQHTLPLVLAFQELYKEYTGRDLIYMEDGASIHRSKATTEAKEELGIKTMQYLKEEWDKIQMDDYRKYIKSMRERCWAVILAGGGPTKW
ncbi:hypothetical protein K469DRAFT_698739 [Zopfia rhizophila CBS 207.26]|uniref:Tc1-like transposase DDE domain-containing protein n=1 Tax=Zopfia rhizophila CBS 207.26 TaxID=1314779 RepID=A0A6A6EZ47_9PEZI|nr:hypothetical protein K469DRAFT_698739 [Zopfia rhizophila CBS 207.26]